MYWFIIYFKSKITLFTSKRFTICTAMTPCALRVGSRVCRYQVQMWVMQGNGFLHVWTEMVTILYSGWRGGCIRQGALKPHRSEQRSQAEGQEGHWVQTASTSWNQNKSQVAFSFISSCHVSSAAGQQQIFVSGLSLLSSYLWPLDSFVSDLQKISSPPVAWLPEEKMERHGTNLESDVWPEGEEADGRCSSLSQLAPAVLRPHRPASWRTRSSAVLSSPSSFAAASSAAPAWFLAPAGKFGSSVSIPPAGPPLRSTARGKENPFWVCRHTA